MSTSLTTTQSTSLTLSHSHPLDQNPAAVYLASLAPGSKRAMRGALNTIAELLGVPEVQNEKSEDVRCLALNWGALRFQHTTAIRAALAERYKPATVNKSLSALRQVLKQAWRLGQISQDDYARAADLAGITGDTLPAGRALGSGELIALMSQCGNDATPAGARDAAIVAILYSCGLRRAELVGLDLASYDAQAGELRVMGKRRKERIVPVVNGAAQALGDWLTLRGSEPGPLFWPIRKGGHLQHGERLTTEAIWHLLRRRATAAGIKSLSPHDFRRTFVGDLLDAGADIATVQKLAGHASVNTTARYDRRPEQAKRRAAELLHVPYTRRRMV